MADVGSLGQYKVVVTADYTQLKTQFEQINQIVSTTAKTITDTLTATSNAVNNSMANSFKAMAQSITTSMKEAQNAMNGFGTEAKTVGQGLEQIGKGSSKAGDGFKSYAAQIRAAEKETQKAFQELQNLQNQFNSITPTSYRDNEQQKALTAQIRQQKAVYDELRQKLDALKQAQEEYKNSVNQTALAVKQAAAGNKAELKAEEENLKRMARQKQGEVRETIRQQNLAQQGEQRVARQQQANAAAQERRIAHLTTQYRVAYEEINKYVQSHTKMSEAVFIRLQGRITALGNEIRRLSGIPPMPNPLEGLDYERYISGFSRLGDVIQSLKHHMAWMASAAVIGGIIGIPYAVSNAIESFDALQTKILQNMELANQYAGNTEKLHSAVNQMGEAAKVYAQGFGVSLAEVQEAMQVLTRRYKDADTAIYLTGIALKMSKLDMIDTKLAAKDLEAVLLQFGMGAKDAGQFLNDFSVICHVARTSGTDMLMALERSGSAFASTAMGAREAMAAIAAVSTVTGKTGSTIGDSWKSILANLDFKKAQAALEAYNIKLYDVGKQGEKVQRQGAVVLTEILQQYAKLDSEGQKKLATAIAGGKYQVNNMQAFLRDSSQSFLTFLKEMKEKSSDATTEQLLKASMNTYETKLKQAKASFEVLGVTIGNMVLPYLKDMAIIMTATGNVIKQNADKVLGLVGVLGRLALAYIAVQVAMMIWAGASAIYTGIAAGITTVANAVKGLAIVEGALAVVTAVKNGLLLLAAPLTMAYAYAATASGVASTVASAGVGFLVGSLTLLEAILAPIGVATLATVAIIATLGVVAYKVYENWETVSNDLTYIWNELVDVVATAIEAVIIAITPFIAIAYALVQVVEWAIKEVIAPVFTWLGQKIKIAIDFCVGVLTWFWNKVKELAAWVVKGIQSIVPGVVGFVSGWASVFQQAIQPLVDFASNVVRIAEKVKNAIKSMLTLGKDSGSEGEGEGIIAKIKSWIGVNDPESEISKAMNAAKAAMELKAGSVDGITGGGAPHGFEPNAIPGGGGGGSKGKGGKGAKGAKGAKEADNSIEAILYRFLTKEKKESHNRAVGELAAIQSMSGFNYKTGEGTDRRGLYGWNQDQWAKYEKWLAGTGQSDSAVSQINYQHTYAQVRDKEEKGKYQDYLKANSITANDFAQAFSQYITKGGAIDSGIVESFDKRFAKKNGEENYDDPMKAIEERYNLLKKEFDAELASLKTERAKKGEKVTAEEELRLYEKMMGIGDGKNPFAYHEPAIKDYEKKLLEMAKYEMQRVEATKKATDTQVSAIEKMADAEVAFAEKLGLFTKKDVREYNWNKNERNYASKRPMLDAMLGGTVDMKKGTTDDMLASLQGLIDAQNETEAKLYADRIMWLSRDVQATAKALDERLKLEEKYQQERYKLEQEAFMYKNRFLYGFVDGFVDAWSSGLESILNRTKSFAEAMQDMFKQLVNSIIRMFVEDWAARLKQSIMNAIHPQTATGFALGTNHTRGQQASQFTGMALGQWAASSLSLMGGGRKSKGGAGTSSGLFAEYLIPTNAAEITKQRMAKMNQVVRQGANTTKNISMQASNQILANEQMNFNQQATAHAQMVNAETQAVNTGTESMVSASTKGQSTILTNIGAIMTQMLAAIAIMAVFSALFGGGGGSKSSTSTSSVNLGRSPDSYYMTPTPVMQSTTFTVPSMDIGGNIEKDMLIYAHKNEMVLTPDQAEVIRNTAKTGGSIGNGGGANANIRSNITVSTIDSRGFDRTMRDYNRNLSKQVKKGIRNGYLNAKGLV